MSCGGLPVKPVANLHSWRCRTVDFLLLEVALCLLRLLKLNTAWLPAPAINAGASVGQGAGAVQGVLPDVRVPRPAEEAGQVRPCGGKPSGAAAAQARTQVSLASPSGGRGK